MILRHHEIGIGYAAAITRLVSRGHELGAHYAYELDGGWALSFGGRAGAGSKTSNDQEASVRWLGLEALVERRTRLGPLGLRAGIGPAVEGVVQTVRRSDADRLLRAGYASERDSRGLLVGGTLSTGARLYPGESIYVGLDARLRVLGGTLQGESAVVLGVSAAASVGVSF